MYEDARFSQHCGRLNGLGAGDMLDAAGVQKKLKRRVSILRLEGGSRIKTIQPWPWSFGLDGLKLDENHPVPAVES